MEGEVVIGRSQRRAFRAMRRSPSDTDKSNTYVESERGNFDPTTDEKKDKHNEENESHYYYYYLW